MPTFQFAEQINFYKGKVRDVYTIGSELLIMIASDRISAFDVILPRLIPFKGQVLNQLSAYMLNDVKDICPNWLIETPTPNASIGYKCDPFKVEIVIRGNLCGHAWRTYNSGHRILCGVLLQNGLRENDFFPSPILTPATKAAEGHDEDISVADIIATDLVSKKDWKVIEQYSLQIFERGREMAAKQGLILADTKYEFGKKDDEIILMDEIHTPDSSRYFYADGFEERQQKNEKQKQLSKEFVREWLIANEFMGKEGQTVPGMTDEWVQIISLRYIELYEKITGLKFKPVTLSNEEVFERITKALEKYS